MGEIQDVWTDGAALLDWPEAHELMATKPASNVRKLRIFMRTQKSLKRTGVTAVRAAILEDQMLLFLDCPEGKDVLGAGEGAIQRLPGLLCVPFPTPP